MRRQDELVGVVDERVAGDARGGLVGPREPAVDHEHAPTALHGVLAVLDFDRHMPAHDMRRLRVHAEVLEDPRDHALVLDKRVEGVLHLLARGLVGDEVQLEGGHLALREQRASLAQPQVPQKVASAAALLGVMAEEGGAHIALHHVVERAALVAAAEHVHFLQAAVGVERHAGMEHEVAVADLVQAAHFQEEAHMTLQFLASGERGLQAAHHLFLGRREREGVLRVDRGEHAIGQRVFHAIDHHGARLVIDLVQQLAAFQPELGVLVDQRRLHLELDDGHGLLDLHVHLKLGRRQVGVALQAETHARIVTVRVKGEARQRQDVDAVGVLQDGQVAVAGAVAHHVRDAAALPEGRAHPHDVVVAPLDVHIMLCLQRLHDDIGLRAAIVDVADDVQLADGQALDELRERLDERDAATGAHRRIKDAGIVRFFVHAVIVLVHQLLDDVGELGGQRLAHAACRVLARRALTHRHQARHHGGVPGALVFHARQDQLRLLSRIVDERGQLALLGLGQLIAERLVHLQTDGTRPVAQDVAERLGFAVDVGAEELRALREVQDGAQVDDLGRRQLLRGE